MSVLEQSPQLLPGDNTLEDLNIFQSEHPTATDEEQASRSLDLEPETNTKPETQYNSLRVVPDVIIVDGETRLDGVEYAEKGWHTAVERGQRSAAEHGLYSDVASRMIQIPGLDHLVSASLIDQDVAPHDPENDLVDYKPRFHNGDSMQLRRPNEYPIKNIKYVGRMASKSQKEVEAEKQAENMTTES